MSFDLSLFHHHAATVADASAAVVALVAPSARRPVAAPHAPHAPHAPSSSPAGPTYDFPDGLEIVTLARGVYWQAFVSRDRRAVCVAVTAAGEYTEYHLLQPGEDWRAVERGMWARLDASDPPLRLLAD